MKAENLAKYTRLLDAEGRVKRWPKKLDEKLFVLEYLQEKLPKGVSFSEKEVDETLIRWHAFGDHALLRREMFDRYLLNRTPDGREYWVGEEKGRPAAPGSQS